MVRSEALIKAQKKYYERIKHTPEYKEKLKISSIKNYEKFKNNEELKQKRNEYAKQYYQNNRESILEKRKIKYQLKKSQYILNNEDSDMYSHD